MTEYTLYLDDSGHPSDKPYVGVAGFLASEDQWVAFELKWKAALVEFGLGEVFHMTDFERQRRPDRGPILQRLTNIIVENTKTSFSCFVEMAAYRKVNDLRPLEEAFGAPYALATRVVVRNINLWRKEHLQDDDHISLFVERGTKHIGDMEEAFKRDGLPIPQRVEKANPRVQAGDMLAWEMAHYDALKPIRRSLMNLLKGDLLPDNHGQMLEANILAALSNAGVVHLRRDLPAGTEHVFHTSPNRPRTRTIR